VLADGAFLYDALDSEGIAPGFTGPGEVGVAAYDGFGGRAVAPAAAQPASTIASTIGVRATACDRSGTA
jgi:hypothetical protein